MSAGNALNTSSPGYLRGSPFRGCLVLALVVLLLGLPKEWWWAPIVKGGQRERIPRGTLRVEVIGDTRLEGIYGVIPGTTVGAFLENLGIEGSDLGGESVDLDQPLWDLSAMVLDQRSGWGLEPMAPGKALLLGEPMDLNRAGIWELTLLPGVGPVTARKIVVHRKTHGPFRDPQDLARVPGIPARTLKAVLPLVTTRLAVTPDDGSPKDRQ